MERDKAVRTTFVTILILIISVGIGFLVFAFTNMLYMKSESQGPYSYDVNFDTGIRTKNLGVVVHLNLSHFAKTWFVGERKNVVLDASAEKVSDLVQNFSWRIFWVELWTFKDGRVHGVGHGSLFLNKSEWNDSYLYKRLNISVDTVNLNYLESVDKAWFEIEIMMNVYYNNTDYGFTFRTPRREIGPVTILSPLYSPISLAIISTAITAISTTVILEHSDKTILTSKKRIFGRTKRKNPNFRTS